MDNLTKKYSNEIFLLYSVYLPSQDLSYKIPTVVMELPKNMFNDYCCLKSKYGPTKINLEDFWKETKLSQILKSENKKNANSQNLNKILDSLNDKVLVDITPINKDRIRMQVDKIL